MATVTEPISAFPRPGLDLYRMTVDEYERLAEAAILVDPRVELIDGYLVRKMTKQPPHVIGVEGVRDAMLSLGLRGWRVMVQDPVRLPDFDEPEPDITLARGSRENYKSRHPGPRDIGMIVEVADSSLAIDRGEKLTVYARAGIARYWIVNLVDGVIETYSNPLSTGQYGDATVYYPGDYIPVVIDGQEVGRIAVSDILG
jgi:Uma2 family endonuclease